jgi:hypothetical protein
MKGSFIDTLKKAVCKYLVTDLTMTVENWYFIFILIVSLFDFLLFQSENDVSKM